MQIPAEQRLQRAQTFDEIADLYDQGRREPPSWLYDTVFSSSGLDPVRAHILEIGCGTGKSTLPLARRGCNVVALEMGKNLARLARQHLAAFPKVQIVNERFEDWSAATHSISYSPSQHGTGSIPRCATSEPLQP
jgi:2-polyprenyl-3-methyl-5-hydroxy-6-metoxy-1,4-benzoquinol methylase